MSTALTIQASEHTPIMTRPDLMNYISRRIMVAQTHEDDRCQIICGRVLKGGGLIGIAFARIGVVMVCLSGSAILVGAYNDDGTPQIDNPNALGMAIPNIVGATVSFGLLSIYSTFNLINEILRTVSPEERALFDTKMTTHRKAGIGATSLLAALLTQVPFAYATYKTAIVVPTFLAITQFLDSGRAGYSTFMTAMGACQARREKYSDQEQYIIQIRDGFVKELGRIQKLLKCNSQQREAFLRLLDTIESGQGEIHEKLLALLNFNIDSPIQSKGPLSSCASGIVTGCSVIMAGAILAELWQLAGLGAAQLWSAPGFNWAASVLVTAANAHLWLSVIHKSTHYVVNFLRNAIPPSLTEKLMPKFYKRFTYFGTLCASVTFVGPTYFAKLGFGDNPGAYYTVAALSSVGSTLGAITAVHAVRDNIIRSYSRQTDPNMRLAMFDAKLQKFAEAIAKTSPQKIAVFLAGLSEGVQDKFINLSQDLVQDSAARATFSNFLVQHVKPTADSSDHEV